MSVMRNVCNRFFNDRRAVGTALAAAIFTLMSLAGVALVGDHKHMTTNRDLLKGATNAATIAAVMELDGRSLGALTAGERSALDATARRYILANIKANVSQDTYQQAVDTLSVTLKDTGPGLVDVDASADLGNIVFGRWLWPTVAKTTEVVSRTERIAGITEVALAIDVTSSMYHDPGGIHPTDPREKSRFHPVPHRYREAGRSRSRQHPDRRRQRPDRRRSGALELPGPAQRNHADEVGRPRLGQLSDPALLSESV